MAGVESNPRNPPFLRFRRMILPVAHNWMTGRGKLHPDLILQSGQQRYTHQRRSSQAAFDEIFQLCPSPLRIARACQLLKHAFAAKIVNQGCLFCAEMTANHCQILPRRRVREKLPDQRISIRLGFCKQHNSRGETIDAVHDESSLPLQS